MSGIKYLSKENLALLRCLALLRDDRGLLTLMYLQLEEIILCKKSNLLSRLSSWMEDINTTFPTYYRERVFRL